MKKYAFLLIYFLSPLIPITAIYSSNPLKYNMPTFAITMIFGSLAYTWLIFEFILSARPKFAEIYFGMDKFYRFHGLMAVISIVLAFLHKTFIERVMGEGGFTQQIGNIAIFIFIAIIILTLVLMVDSIIQKIKPISVFRKTIEKIHLFKYEHYLFIHNATIIALIAMFVHVQLSSSAQNSLLVRSVYILYFTIGISFYLYHKIIKIALLKKNKYNITDIIKESANMWTIRMIPEKGKVFSYLPGQFLFIRFLGKNISQEEHPFSISSEPNNRDYLDVTIKELGDFTRKIGKIQISDKAVIDAPYGKYSYLNHSKNRDIVLIAGGVGITPVMSMLRYMKISDKDKKTMLIWGVNTINDIIIPNEFEEMQKVMKNFIFIPVMFRDDNWQGEKGIINKDKIKQIFEKYNQELLSKDFYICGPGIMLGTATSALKELGVANNNIHYEKFSL